MISEEIKSLALAVHELCLSEGCSVARILIGEVDFGIVCYSDCSIRVFRFLNTQFLCFLEMPKLLLMYGKALGSLISSALCIQQVQS